MSVLLGPLFFLPLLAIASAQEPAKKEGDKKEGESLIVIGASGKETSFKKWKILQGTRTVVGESDSITPVEKADKPAKVKAPTGPEYLEFREDNSTDYKDGILTLIPMTSLHKVDYDKDKKSVSVAVTLADGKDVVLTGTTKYKGINNLTLDVDVEVGDLGSTKLKLQGGLPGATPLIRGFRFPSIQPAPKVSGPVAVIAGVDKDKSTHKVHDLKAMYRVGNVDRFSSYLLFKADMKIEVSKIVKFRKAPADKKQVALEYEVTPVDGKPEKLSLVKDAFTADGQRAQFLGLIGKVGAGYKLFPLHTMTEMRKEE
jgi:hypothetical protein